MFIEFPQPIHVVTTLIIWTDLFGGLLLEESASDNIVFILHSIEHELFYYVNLV